MKKTGFQVVALLLIMLLAVASFAQQRTSWKRDNVLGPGNLYDPNTVERYNGEVISVDQFAPNAGMPAGLELVLKTDSQQAIKVFLGPQWYFENEDFEFAPGDRLEIKGSKITYAGEPALIAAVIFKGDRVLKLRDESGAPVWSPWVPRH